MTKQEATAPIELDRWIEQDLSQAELAPAFGVEDLVAQVEGVLRLGGRSPVLVGPRGVGKTAVIHEILRRARSGDFPELAGRRVVQLSLRGLASRFKNKGEANGFVQSLLDHVSGLSVPPLVYIRDVHVAYALDLEGALHRFLVRLDAPILAEAYPRELDQLLEYWGDLNELLVSIPVREPSLDQTREVVRQWSTWQHQAGRGPIHDDAQRMAIELTARFMGNRHFPRKALDLLRETRDLVGEGQEVGITQVVSRFAQLTRVPGRLVDPEVPLDLQDLVSFLEGRLLGQEEAVDTMVRMIALIKAGLADLRRPFGVFLFVGPTGVGKTHTAQLLAEYLFGDRHRLIRINMADYGTPQDVEVLFGNPHAQAVALQRGLVTQRLAGHPFGVLLLDEFEKAHPKVHDAFLQLMDEGRFINGRSEVVSATSLIIIATSNAGAEVYRETGLGFGSARTLRQLDEELDRRLLERFRFEFLNRFDRVVHFHPLDRAHIRDIARRELGQLLLRDGIRARSLEVEVDVEVLDWLVAHGYHPHYGARFLRREIERSITSALADAIVRSRPSPGSKLHLGVRKDRVHVRVAEPPPPLAEVSLPRGDQEITVSLGPDALLDEAHTWLRRFQPLIEAHDHREKELAQLMERSLAPGFWDDAREAQEVLRRYKTLDARIQADHRLLGAVRRLATLVESEEPPRVEDLARLVQKVGRNHKRWLELEGEDEPNGAWLLLGPADSVALPGPGLAKLVEMYLLWLDRNGLEAEVVAEEAVGGSLVRTVLEVEGSGTNSVLEMEAGQHRIKTRGGVDKLLVEVIPRSDEPAPLPEAAKLQDARKGRGLLLEQRAARLKLDVPSRGLRIRLTGTDRSTLGLLATDLCQHLREGSSTQEVARTYGISGAVHDPRTGASHGSIKDVLSRGRLEVFLRAWSDRHTQTS